jgi:hypothetical protein
VHTVHHHHVKKVPVYIKSHYHHHYDGWIWGITLSTVSTTAPLFVPLLPTVTIPMATDGTIWLNHIFWGFDPKACNAKLSPGCNVKGQPLTRRIAQPMLDVETGWCWVVEATPRPLCPQKKVPVPIVQMAGWAPRSVWTGVKNFVPTEVQTTNRPVRSESLYRLSYPSSLLWILSHAVSIYLKSKHIIYFLKLL